MQSRVKVIGAAVVSVLMLAGGVASAQTAQPAQSAPASNQPWMGGRMDTNLYIGAHVGRSKFRNACDNIAGSCDDKDVGWKVTAGYQFHKHLAIEGGYYDLGKASASENILGIDVSRSARARGFELVAVGLLPLSQQFSLLAKVGAARTTLRARASATDGIDTIEDSFRERSTDLTYGIGAQYIFTPNIAGRIEWQRYDSVGGGRLGKENLDLLSAGVYARF